MADGGEEVYGVSVVSDCDAPEVLQSAEHALDGIAVTVEERREAVLPFAVGLGRMLGIAPRCRNTSEVAAGFPAG